MLYAAYMRIIDARTVQVPKVRDWSRVTWGLLLLLEEGEEEEEEEGEAEPL